MTKRALAVSLIVALNAPALGAAPSPRELLEAGHFKQVRAIATPRVAANPKDAEALYLLSCARLALGDVDGALDLATRAVALDGSNSAYHLQLGLATGRKATTVNMFSAASYAQQFSAEIEKAVALDPRNAEARWNLMSYYSMAPSLMGGDMKKARDEAGQLMALKPARGFLALAAIATAEKDTAGTEQNQLKAVAADPQSFDANIALARLYVAEERRDFAKAEPYAKQAARLAPDRAAGHAVLAIVYTRTERWRELDALLLEAEKQVPDNLSPYFQSGLALVTMKKDAPRAERYFRKYLTQEAEGQGPLHSRAYWRLGQALEQQGRKSEAIAAVQTALKLEPGLAGARADLKRLGG